MDKKNSVGRDFVQEVKHRPSTAFTIGTLQFNPCNLLKAAVIVNHTQEEAYKETFTLPLSGTLIFDF